MKIPCGKSASVQQLKLSARVPIIFLNVFQMRLVLAHMKAVNS